MLSVALREDLVGEALQKLYDEHGLKREDLYIQTKLFSFLALILESVLTSHLPRCRFTSMDGQDPTHMIRTRLSQTKLLHPSKYLLDS